MISLKNKWNLKKLLNLNKNVHSFLSQLLDFDKSSFFQKLQASFISSFLLLTLKIHTYRIFVWHHEIVLNSKHDIFDNTDLDLLHSSSTFFLVEEKKLPSCHHTLWQQTPTALNLFIFFTDAQMIWLTRKHHRHVVCMSIWMICHCVFLILPLIYLHRHTSLAWQILLLSCCCGISCFVKGFKIPKDSNKFTFQRELFDILLEIYTKKKLLFTL